MRFREIADVNGLNPLEPLPINATLAVPDIEGPSSAGELPILGSLSGLVSGGGIGDVDFGALVTGITGSEGLPSQLSGYLQTALQNPGDLNGVVGDIAQSILGDAIAGLDGEAGKYGEWGTKLIDWLLQ